MSKQINQIAIFMVLLLVLTPFAFAEQLQIKKVSDLKPGDVIIDQKTGKEIPVESIQATDFKFMTNLLQIMTGKLPAVSMTGNVIAPVTGKAFGVNVNSVPSSVSAPIQTAPSTSYLAGPNDYYTSNLKSSLDAAATAPSTTAAITDVPPAQVIVGGPAPSTAVVAPNTVAPISTQLPASSSVTYAEGTATNSLWAGGTSYASGSALAPGTYSAGTFDIIGQSPITLKAGQSMAISSQGTTTTWTVTDASGKVIQTGSGVGEKGLVTANGGVTGASTQGSSAASRFLGAGGGTYGDALVSGLQWAVVAYFAAQMLGPMFGLDKKQTDALSMSLAAGALVGKGLAVLTGPNGAWAGFGQSSGTFATNAGAWSAGIGIAVAAVIFIMMYKDTKTEVVTFSCQPWQAPTSKNGGTDCEVCNNDRLPCSEYRCKSLGQACELVNPGTGNEKCVYVNPKDVTPPVITPNDKDLPSTSYKYTNVKLSPPGPGFTVTYTNSSDGCIKAFTPLTFGITTDEPSQCKIDFNHTEKLTDMAYWMGGSNLYLYNHTERFSLPGPANLKKENLTVENGGKWTFYLRCRDKNGNENAADYALRFCVDPTPDTTAPVVKATSIENGACVAANNQNASVGFYLNEPSTCRWSKTDQTYDLMQNNMSCSNRLEQMNAQQLYTCNTNLDSISRDGTEYFIRCKDNADNKMATSYKFSLKGSNPLLIKTARPNETVYGGVNPAPVELFVQTAFGCENNKAICAYSTTDNLGDYVVFYDTNTEDGVNTQKLFFSQGTKKVNVRCVDSGGNLANVSLNFNVEIDTAAPVVARVYEEDNLLKIITVRDSECSFTNDDCSFLFEEGTEMPIANSTTHVTEWIKDKTYYIKCRDEFQNEEAGCSAIIKPVNNFL